MEEGEGEREISMVKASARNIYDERTDAKHYAGLMTLDQIKGKRARIESGEEFETETAKAQRALKADAIESAREAQARAARMAAKKDKAQKELAKVEPPDSKTQAVDKKTSVEGSHKKEKQKSQKGALSFSHDDQEGENEDDV